jgi:hypothetical protein
MRQGRLHLSIGLVMIGIIVSVAGCNTDRRARVIFDNQSPCGPITVTLTDTTTQQKRNVKVPISQRIEVELTAAVFYDYVVDFTTANKTSDNLKCTAVESGKVQVPAGTVQTFALRAETPVPTQ